MITIFVDLVSSTVCRILIVDYLLYLISLDGVLFQTSVLIIEIFFIVIFIVGMASFFIFLKGILYFLFILFVDLMIKLVLHSLVFFGINVLHFDVVYDILNVFSFKNTGDCSSFNELRFVRIAFNFAQVGVVGQRPFFAGMEISFCRFVDLRPCLRLIVRIFSLRSLFGKRFRSVWQSICDLCHIRFSSFNRLEVSNCDVVSVNIFHYQVVSFFASRVRTSAIITAAD